MITPLRLAIDAMARPLSTGKQSVNLASNGAPGSRIRRDPPPAVKETPVVDPEERERRAVIVGVLSFALAICVLIIAAGSYSGWSMGEYTVRL